MELAFSACGFLVGCLVGFTGMGGGSVMTAMLILLFGVHPVTAVGTDLLFAAVTKSVGARVHSGQGNVAWTVVGLLALGSVPGTLIALLVLSQLPIHDPAVAKIIKQLIGLALLVAGSSLLLSRDSPRFADVDGTAGQPERARAVLTVVLGLFLGILVSLTSVGAGALGLVILRRLYPNVSSVRLVGSDIAHAVPLTLLAGSGHWWLGGINWMMLALLLLGSIPGIIVGSHFAHRVPDGLLRTVLGVVLIVIAVSLILA